MERLHAGMQEETGEFKAEKALFGTAINCMDGRVQGAVRKHMKKMHGLTYIDKITDAGPNKALAKYANATVWSAMVSAIWHWILGIFGLENTFIRVRRLLRISIINHDSKIVAIVAHHDCTVNPAGKEAQIKDLLEAEKTVRRIIKSFKLKYRIDVMLLWINASWMPEEINVPDFVVTINS